MLKKNLLPIILISFIINLNAQWPTAVDTALFVDYGIYPNLVVDEEDQSITIVYLRDNGIWAKKFDKDGYPLWNGNHVVLSDTAYGWIISEVASNGQWAAVINDGQSGVVVAWEDYRHATFDDFEGFPEGSEVYLQRVDRDGNILYGTNGKLISGPATDGWHSIGDMKPDYNGGFYIGFNRDSTAEMSVLKHFDIDGHLQWERFFAGLYMDISATNKRGEVFVNTNPDGKGSRHKLDLSGSYLWPDTLIGNIYDSFGYRSGGALPDGDGGVIGVGSIGFLKIRRVDSTGQYAWDEVDLKQGQFSQIRYAPDGEGGIYVNWSKEGINLQKVDINGKTVFGENNLSICSLGDCRGAVGLISDKKNGAIAAWADISNDTTNSYYMQRIDSSGLFLWDSLGIEFHSTSLDPFFTGGPIHLYSDKRGGAILLWNECCNGNQILIKQISANGILGEVVTSLSNASNAAPNQIELYQNYPNPFNPSTTISFNIVKSTKVNLKVFNTLGMEIITLLDKRLNRGAYKIPLALENMASGIYYYQLKTDDQTKTKRMLLIR